jgi:hypothetical protein
MLSQMEFTTSRSDIASPSEFNEGCFTISNSGNRINATITVVLKSASHKKGPVLVPDDFKGNSRIF